MSTIMRVLFTSADTSRVTSVMDITYNSYKAKLSLSGAGNLKLSAKVSEKPHTQRLYRNSGSVVLFWLFNSSACQNLPSRKRGGNCNCLIHWATVIRVRTLRRRICVQWKRRHKWKACHSQFAVQLRRELDSRPKSVVYYVVRIGAAV